MQFDSKSIHFDVNTSFHRTACTAVLLDLVKRKLAKLFDVSVDGFEQFSLQSKRCQYMNINGQRGGLYPVLSSSEISIRLLLSSIHNAKLVKDMRRREAPTVTMKAFFSYGIVARRTGRNGIMCG